MNAVLAQRIVRRNASIYLGVTNAFVSEVTVSVLMELPAKISMNVLFGQVQVYIYIQPINTNKIFLTKFGFDVEGDDLCMGSCINTPGSYKCQCPVGYEIQEDGRTCKGESYFDNFVVNF